MTNEDIEEIKKLINQVSEEKSRLAKNQFVPLHELEILVFTTYTCSMISSGRSCELLNITLEEFRLKHQVWINLYPELQYIYHTENIKNFELENNK